MLDPTDGGLPDGAEEMPTEKIICHGPAEMLAKIMGLIAQAEKDGEVVFPTPAGVMLANPDSSKPLRILMKGEHGFQLIGVDGPIKMFIMCLAAKAVEALAADAKKMKDRSMGELPKEMKAALDDQMMQALLKGGGQVLPPTSHNSKKGKKPEGKN